MKYMHIYGQCLLMSSTLAEQNCSLLIKTYNNLTKTLQITDENTYFIRKTLHVILKPCLIYAGTTAFPTTK